MGILTADMQRVVREQRLFFVATVCPDGTPNLSPKGATAVWDDDHLLFADIRSPGTIRNLRRNPAIEKTVEPSTAGVRRRIVSTDERRRQDIRERLSSCNYSPCRYGRHLAPSSGASSPSCAGE